MSSMDEMREEFQESIRNLTRPEEDGWAERFVLASEGGALVSHLMAMRKILSVVQEKTRKQDEWVLGDPLEKIEQGIEDLMDAMAEGALLAGIEEQAEESARNN